MDAAAFPYHNTKKTYKRLARVTEATDRQPQPNAATRKKCHNATAHELTEDIDSIDSIESIDSISISMHAGGAVNNNDRN